jgi:hypothetical protein
VHHHGEIVRYEFALRGTAKEGERALEEACLERFGTIRPEGATPSYAATTDLCSRVGVSGRP